MKTKKLLANLWMGAVLVAALGLVTWMIVDLIGFWPTLAIYTFFAITNWAVDNLD